MRSRHLTALLIAVLVLAACGTPAPVVVTVVVTPTAGATPYPPAATLPGTPAGTAAGTPGGSGATGTPGASPPVGTLAPACTPVVCPAGELLICASGDCADGCGLACATPSPGPGAPAVTVTPPPGATIVAGQGPAIDYFQASVLYAQPGQALTLAWQSQNGAQAALHQADASGRLGQVLASTPTGAISYTVPLDALDAQRFALFVTDGAGYTSQATLAVRVPCPAVWFFASAPPECPGGPAAVGPAAEQHFEGGVMLWSGVEDRIYVLFSEDALEYDSGPAWASYPDLWTVGMAETDPAFDPPAGSGFYQPKRGFGRVWREQPGVRERLGWATDPEFGFDMSVQRTARVGGNVLYLEALHEGTWALGPNGGPWHFVP